MVMRIIVAVVAPLGAAGALGVRGRSAATPTVPEILDNLRAQAAAAVQNQSSVLAAAGANFSTQYTADLNKEVVSARSVREARLANINLPGEESLRGVKQELDDARWQSANLARASAARGVAAVERDARAQTAEFVREAQDLTDEAHRMSADATEASGATETAALSAEGWRSKWPRQEINDALRFAEEINATSPKMRDKAATAEQIATLVDDAAAHTLEVIQEALKSAHHADVLASQAVDQAGQNSLKLKAIREMVVEAQGAAVAQVKKVSAPR